MKCTEGYHKQKLTSENFFEVIQYIKYHDAGTVKRMSKKSRLEKLLEMVEMELKMKNTEEKDYGYDNMPELRRQYRIRRKMRTLWCNSGSRRKNTVLTAGQNWKKEWIHVRNVVAR